MEKTTAIQILLCLALGYLLGCVSPSYIFGRVRGYDVRSSGSKNAGASNTVLMAGKFAGLAVALLDMAKAAAAWLLCAALCPELDIAPALGGAACVIGHMYPVFLRFHGGKGLACLGGVILAYDPKTFLLMLLVALLIGLASNYVCIVTVSMSLIFPAYYGYVTALWLGAAILAVPAAPIFIKHIENFRRIKTGQELRLSFLWNKNRELRRIGYEE
ncbi:MAG: glycerol-3-phosphate acyltransferase [Oscillospiraceae bacterium]|nr:glycerol-3-phosphate acyltransferase [Oscillospiraceae bacterium]